MNDQQEEAIRRSQASCETHKRAKDPSWIMVTVTGTMSQSTGYQCANCGIKKSDYDQYAAGAAAFTGIFGHPP